MGSVESIDSKRRNDAIQWFFTIEDASVSDKELEAFAHWYTSDPRNIDAYDEVRHYWSELGELSQSDFPSESEKYSVLDEVIENDISSKQAEKAKASVVTLITDNNVKQSKNPVSKWGYAAAASILFVLSASVLWFSSSSNHVNPIVYKTDIAEVRSIILEDNSELVLGANSKASVAYSNDERIVTVHRGDAFFDVISDAERPFLVNAKSVTVNVIGTEFDVQIKPNDVFIAVAEGVVSVGTKNEKSTSDSTQPSRLHVGQKLKIGLSDNSSQLMDVVPESIGDWQNHQLSYTEQTLETIVSDLARYHDGTIHITDNAKALTVSASFDARKVDEILDSLAELLPIVVTKSPSGYILIQSTP